MNVTISYPPEKKTWFIIALISMLIIILLVSGCSNKEYVMDLTGDNNFNRTEVEEEVNQSRFVIDEDYLDYMTDIINRTEIEITVTDCFEIDNWTDDYTYWVICKESYPDKYKQIAKILRS